MLRLGNPALRDFRQRRSPDMGAEGRGPVTVPTICASGLVAGTRVATARGWCAVEAVRPGDLVLTFDAGLQQVTQVARGALWSAAGPCPRHLWPLAVPEGALGNAQPMLLLPGQSVLIESDVAAELFGDRFTMVPAGALEGFRGIERVEPLGSTAVVRLYFSREEAVFGAAGALLACPSIRSASLTLDADETGRVVLDRDDAAFLIGCIEMDDARQGVTPDRHPAQAARAA